MEFELDTVLEHQDEQDPSDVGIHMKYTEKY